MATTANWTCEENLKLVSLWSEDVIQEQLEGCRRNRSVYSSLADDLYKAGFSRTLEQCRDKIKKLKGEYKKVHNKRETTGEGRYPEWEFFDALDNVLGPKHSMEQDMSGEPAAHSAPPSNNSFVNRQQDSETQPSMSETQPIGRETQLSDIGIQPSESGSKSRKRKQGRNEAINELLEKVKCWCICFCCVQ